MSIALDLGASMFRSLRIRGDQLVARNMGAQCALIPACAAHQKWLDRAGVEYLTGDGYFVVPGVAAQDSVKLFQGQILPLLPEGTISATDPVSRQVVALLVESLLPRPEQAGEICAFTQPGLGSRTHSSDTPLTRRLEFVARLIRLRGYEPRPINPAAALVLAEMAREGFSGVAICLGAASCEIGVAHRGVLNSIRRLPRGGQWIDEQFARETATCRWDAQGHRLLDLAGACRFKETVSLTQPVAGEGRLIADLFRRLIRELVMAVELMLFEARIAQPVAVVCGGGTARIAGLTDVFQQELDRRQLGPAVAGIRVAGTSAESLARGCLIHAEMEAQSPAIARRKVA